jgi:hypothetical protein
MELETLHAKIKLAEAELALSKEKEKESQGKKRIFNKVEDDCLGGKSKIITIN